MPYKIKHSHVKTKPTVRVDVADEVATIHVSTSGTFRVRFPGKLFAYASATYYYRLNTGGVEGEEQWIVDRRHVPVTFKIMTPDGVLFTPNHITMADLKKYRDLRGTTHGEWSYHVFGQTTEAVIEGESEVTRGTAEVLISVEETVPSESAREFVDYAIGPYEQVIRCDLFRVGMFTAKVTLLEEGSESTITPRGLKLLDPDGVQVASTTTGFLEYPVTLATLGKSRSAAGEVRKWQLRVLPSGGADDEFTNLWATVVGTSHIHTSVLQQRIDDLLGVNGSKISLYFETKGEKLLTRLKVRDEFTAAWLDLHGLLDDMIEGEDQDEGANAHIKPEVAYTLHSNSRSFSYELNIQAHDLGITQINVGIGQSTGIDPSTPTLFLGIRTTGKLTFNIGDFPLVDIRIRDNQIAVEAGARLGSIGSLEGVAWIQPNRIDMELHWAAAVIAGILNAPLLALGASGFANLVELWVNNLIQEQFCQKILTLMDKVPYVMGAVMGCDLTYLSMRLEAGDLVFKYLAPVEPEPKPPESYEYIGVIGRHVVQQPAFFHFEITPPSLGDTWAAPNLMQKIDHIVVVMMENRSFDHVLGYRAQLPGLESENGLSQDLLNFISGAGQPTPKRLRDSGILPNSQGLKTKFDSSIKPSFSAVAEQLGEKIPKPGGAINSPKGFITSFEPRVAEPLTKGDILGYYVGEDLEMFRFLARYYAYSETYFSSHPGPTLPNRMYLLSGAVQHDRAGEAILDNNSGGNIALSRAMCIFDLLSRRGVSWRVYESYPSLTMLRMFARYVTDNNNIVNIARLEQDVFAGNLPSVTMIDPVMHHPPHNDDHPPADMYEGQRFVQRVYDALRSNDALWSRTMLIVTYDEHGGFYDHVNPGIAEIRRQELVFSEGGGGSGGPATAISVFTNYGVRVPLFVASPHVPEGVGPRIVLDHCSILKTILARFCPDKPFVSDRVEASHSLDAYLSAPIPRMNVPMSPDLPISVIPSPSDFAPSITTKPVSREDLIDGDVDFHDLSGMLGRMLGR